MRGKEVRVAIIRGLNGITPAYAGKRSKNHTDKGAISDHPRVCGEKAASRAMPSSGQGSPPRMRGKGRGAHSFLPFSGITPAYAGKRARDPVKAQETRDHPRVCGEKLYLAPLVRVVLGSPPRMRGKVMVVDVCDIRIGITPAYAGKRLKRSHSIGHFSCILCLFHSVLHRASVSGGSRAGPCAPPCLPAQNAVPV